MKSIFQYYLSDTINDIIKKKSEVIIMAYLIAFIIVFGIPYYFNKKEESRKRQDMYNNLNKKSIDEMEKWRR